jgi:DNA ligase (NAD+)
MDYNLVKTLPDIYRLDWDMVASLSGSGVAKRARESLESKGQNITFTDFMSALNIRYLDTRAKSLVSIGIDTPEELLKSNVSQLETAEGIGETKAIEIRKSIEKLRPIIKDLGSIIKFKEKSGNLVGLSFCFTGQMSRPRKELEDMALDAGAEVKKSVSAGLTHLVIADPNSTTTKAQKARELGTKCISEEEFKGMCNV